MKSWKKAGIYRFVASTVAVRFKKQNKNLNHIGSIMMSHQRSFHYKPPRCNFENKRSRLIALRRMAHALNANQTFWSTRSLWFDKPAPAYQTSLRGEILLNFPASRRMASQHTLSDLVQVNPHDNSKQARQRYSCPLSSSDRPDSRQH